MTDDSDEMKFNYNTSAGSYRIQSKILHAYQVCTLSIIFSRCVTYVLYNGREVTA